MRVIKLLVILTAVILTGCSQLNKASDYIANPTAKEVYKRDFNLSDTLFTLWENQVDLALEDSIQVELPYAEKGKFLPRTFPVYSYEIALTPGELFNLEIETDSIKELVFIDVFRKTEDSLNPYKKLESAEFGEKQFTFEAKSKGKYKIVIQPAIEANSPFLLKMIKSPVYLFPVASYSNSAIQSFWGAQRDGGARNHEGIDIFAERGTPVVAATSGRITYTGEKGLGGKQVWLRDGRRGQSLYYAHLDSINLVSGSVKVGDTLGFVGNTGNAKTTPPHLHFGIYKNFQGAIDPLNFVFLPEPLNLDDLEDEIPHKILTKAVTANLRNKPTTSGSKIIGSSKAQDTLQILGKSKDWYHIRTPENKASFIHQSLVKPI
ncbi:M23 family metallopeptidase [Salegentibacter sp. F188]|uniref:M23 family metallopeptidase n=1 Tax=Autumnicola patrickiae TaxID=3075591 RepID=A0ABU3E429_9FLAO|nr:M23 family metallopeptidase [Salegentibacter sp. F188]MDT0690761.1 M23 family metallopeptidase [Salegentibacter sp. F188]